MSNFVNLCLVAVAVSPFAYRLIRWRWPDFHHHDRYPRSHA